MNQQLGDLSCQDSTFRSTGSKRQKCEHRDDAPTMSKKLKEISEPLLSSVQEDGMLSPNLEPNFENDLVLMEGNAGNRNSFKSHTLSCPTDGNNSAEVEAGLHDVTLVTVLGNAENSLHSNINSKKTVEEQASSLKSASEQSSLSCTHHKYKGASSKVPQNQHSNRKGFWEALKVHIERPHILNRRLCGVVDVWWGSTSSCSKSEESEKTFLKDASVEPMQKLKYNRQEEEALNQRNVCLGDSLFDIARTTWHVLNSGIGSEIPAGDEVNISSSVLKRDLKLTVLERKVIAVLLGRGFKAFDCKDPLVEVCAGLGSGSAGRHVVVRRVLPKLQERYASVTEVVVMDGTSDSCCFLSEVTVPPLLPARPYVIRCSAWGGAAGDTSVETGAEDSDLRGMDHLRDVGSGAGVGAAGSSVAHADAIAADALDTEAGTGSTTAADAATSAADAVTVADVGVTDTSTAVANGVSAGTASKIAAAGSATAQDDSSQTHLPLNPCGFFQCFFITGICENSGGDTSKGDGRVWLESTVLPRLQKWALPLGSREPPTRSLQLVDLQSYGVMYHNLKSKYAAHLIQSWSERTDPKKFVHEDIGIATYLLLLWSERSRPQRFVDLGCGNGLLVYILTKEGHVGAGYDIKRRNIWRERFSDIDLQEREVRPDLTFDADVDWLIGNHSDELTPWLPVMAARCSQTCSFFLLPCCPHDFTAKFVRRNTNKSQYGDYLDYISEVGQVCGFKMERDRLKIPSTKRECFVGRLRLHSEQDRPSVLAAMQQFIDSKIAQCGRKLSCDAKKSPVARNEMRIREERAPFAKKSDSVGVQPDAHQSNGWRSTSTGKKEGDALARNDGISTESEQEPRSLNAGESSFTVRPKEQRVRNCTRLAKGVKEDLVKCVVDFLLQGLDVKTEEWSQGACTELRSAAGMLRPEQLLQIKQECGGLKTLLKNHRHIFLVEGSTVRLRVPGRVPEFEKRQRPCWFSVHHPQGCPNTAAECMYCH